MSDVETLGKEGELEGRVATRAPHLCVDCELRRPCEASPWTETGVLLFVLLLVLVHGFLWFV